MKSKLYRAGLLPYIVEDGHIKFLFMKPADPRFGGDRFQIAKGKVEDGESKEEAALREASEELGLVLDNIDAPVYLGDYLGRTSFYVAAVRNKTNFNQPHFETGETAWLSVSEFQNVGRALHVPIVQIAARTAYLTVK